MIDKNIYTCRTVVEAGFCPYRFLKRSKTFWNYSLRGLKSCQYSGVYVNRFHFSQPFFSLEMVFERKFKPWATTKRISWNITQILVGKNVRKFIYSAIIVKVVRLLQISHKNVYIYYFSGSIEMGTINISFLLHLNYSIKAEVFADNKLLGLYLS